MSIYHMVILRIQVLIEKAGDETVQKSPPPPRKKEIKMIKYDVVDVVANKAEGELKIQTNYW